MLPTRTGDAMRNFDVVDLPLELAGVSKSLKGLVSEEAAVQPPQRSDRVVPFGIRPLDRLAGLVPKQLVVVAARPAMSPTQFALRCCLNVAGDKQNPIPVLYFSLRMPRDALLLRMPELGTLPVQIEAPERPS